jgi:hypothetical protein
VSGSQANVTKHASSLLFFIRIERVGFGPKSAKTLTGNKIINRTITDITIFSSITNLLSNDYYGLPNTVTHE